ncbi:CPBP family intramembrane glutamic endopeptidase [Kitasatospora sp. NPDC056138]|uniref:CPBP family intramembrane glutamic endopeptidase n=1 Tax=Kitasatospora sp. NPDC056138 TaxID=3345724 RepID=UPI0035DEA3EF
MTSTTTSPSTPAPTSATGSPRLQLTALLVAATASTIGKSLAVFAAMWGLDFSASWLLPISIAAVGCWSTVSAARRAAPDRTQAALRAGGTCVALLAAPGARVSDAMLIVAAGAFCWLTAALVGDLVQARTGHGVLTAPSAENAWLDSLLVGVALFAAAFVATHLMGYAGAHLPAWLPSPAHSQAATAGVHGYLSAAAIIGHAAVIEELLMTAAVCVLGRDILPAWVIYTVSVSLRVAAHLYLGFAGIPVAILGITSVYLYRKYGRILPLMTAHFAFDFGQLFISY